MSQAHNIQTPFLCHLSRYRRSMRRRNMVALVAFRRRKDIGEASMGGFHPTHNPAVAPGWRKVSEER